MQSFREGVCRILRPRDLAQDHLTILVALPHEIPSPLDVFRVPATTRVDRQVDRSLVVLPHLGGLRLLEPKPLQQLP